MARSDAVVSLSSFMVPSGTIGAFRWYCGHIPPNVRDVSAMIGLSVSSASLRPNRPNSAITTDRTDQRARPQRRQLETVGQCGGQEQPAPDNEGAQFRILGTIEVAGLGWPGLAPQQLRLLGILLINLNEVVPTEVIADTVRVDRTRAPGTPRRAVQMAASRLRKALDAVSDVALLTVGGGYELVADPERVDLFQAAEAVRATHSMPPENLQEIDVVARRLRETVFGQYATVRLRTMSAAKINRILSPHYEHPRPTVLA